MNVLAAATVSASALEAEKMRLDLIAQNIANAGNTKDIQGGPYQRKVASFETVLDAASPNGRAVKVAKVVDDKRPGIQVYSPQHPHADRNGNVQMPNVDVAHEMVDMISASRAYEANLAVVRNARQIAAQALSIGR
jgi:flagellar basal-body rod protein FlgC